MVMENDKGRLACFFDSGIGGLPLLAECYRRRKDCNFAYFADNYNVPYGNMPHDEILKRTDDKFSLISELAPDVAVVACNTVTAECVEFLRGKYKFPIIGVQPAVKPAAAEHENCIVLATPATASSRALAGLVSKFGGNRTRILPCTQLAQYVENNFGNFKKEEVFALLPPAECDCVVLGCTHYGYVAEAVSEYYSAPVYDGIKGTADRFEKILGISDHRENEGRDITFYGGNYSKNAFIFNFLTSRGVESGLR